MDHSQVISQLEDHLTWVENLEHDSLKQDNREKALAQKSILNQIKQFLRLSFGTDSDYYLKFAQLAFYYIEDKPFIFDDTKARAVDILQRALTSLTEVNAS